MAGEDTDLVEVRVTAPDETPGILAVPVTADRSYAALQRPAVDGAAR